MKADLFERAVAQVARMWGTRVLSDANISWGDVILWVGFGIIVLAALVIIIRFGREL